MSISRRSSFLVFLSAVCATGLYGQSDDKVSGAEQAFKLENTVPSGTPLRIALDQRMRIAHAGETVHGRVVETVYAFDEAVIPAGTVASGHIRSIAPVRARTRVLAYANGNFSPFHAYQLTFDQLTFPDGRKLSIHTTVSPGAAEIVRLVANPEKEKRKNAAARAAENAKKEASSKIHEGISEIKSPGRLARLKAFVLAQSPYRRQYIAMGTRFNATLQEAIPFGELTRTAKQLAAVGSEPAPDSTLHARLVSEVSSASAQRGTAILAMVTEPLYSPTHELILPVNSRLIGEVAQAKRGQKFHRNGELRVVFKRIETPEEISQVLSAADELKNEQAAETPQLHTRSQAMVGNLEGVEVDRAANMKLDEEGGARTTDSKKRYLTTGLALALAAASAHPDTEHGTVDSGGDPGVRTAAGGSGFGFTGALVGLAVMSTPVSMAFGAYGAATSVYSNFLSRGRDVVLPKDTPLEIGFGRPHTPATAGNAEESPERH